MISLILPLRLQSVANLREHWGARAKRAKRERRAVKLAWLVARPARVPLPALVTLTRIAPGKLDDDNLASGCKAIRDAVADCLGVDDGDTARIRWAYAQERGPYGVRIEVEAG